MCGHVYAHMYTDIRTCHRPRLGVREQLSGVNSFLLLRGSQESSSGHKALAACAIICRAILPVPTSPPLFFLQSGTQTDLKFTM